MPAYHLNPIPLSRLIPGMAEETFRRDELALTSYRPTIVIGVGGTGLEVVRRLKKLLRRYYRTEELEIFQFIVFDTAAQEVPEGEEPLDAGEFCYLGAFDAADMIRHLNENHYIARWWPGGTKRPYRPKFSGTGANRVRAVGRLVLFIYLGNTILPRLQAKIDRAIEVNAQHGMGASSIKFYIVCSLAGGTGSGMVLDLAYICRMLGLRTQSAAYLTGILVLDDAFLPKAQTQNTAAEFSANTYAALREINYFSAVRRFSEQYDEITSTKELPEGFPPFDVTYLLSLHNSAGQALDSFESLADMIAAEMMLEIASPLKNRTENVLDNVRANERSIAGQPAAFSSFALSSLVYPLQGIASWCGLKAHETFSREVLLTPRRTVADVDSDVLAFMQKAGVEEERADSLIDRLNLDDKGESMTTPSLSHDQVAGLSESQLLGSLQRLEESAQAELAHIRETLAINVEPVWRRYLIDLKAETDHILTDPQRGPRYAAWFTASLADRLAAQRDEQMIGEQAAYRADVDASEAAWRVAKESLARSLRLPRWLPWRRWRINNARSAYTTAFNNYLVATHELERRTQAILCFNVFIEETRSLARQANDLVNEWTKLSKTANQRAETELVQIYATETEYSLMRNIVGREELRRTYERYLPEMDDPDRLDYLASQFWQFFKQQVPDWTLATGSIMKPNEGAPHIQVYYFLANWYAEQLKGKTLVDHLKEIYGESWKHEVNLCYQQTVPFWHFTLSRFGDKINNNLQHEPRLVGYGEDGASNWPQIVNDVIGDVVEGVNNKNPHEMLFLKTSHGLPLFALRSIRTLRASYDYVRRLWEKAAQGNNPIPVHVSSTWEDLLPEIDPVSASEKPENGSFSELFQPDGEKSESSSISESGG